MPELVIHPQTKQALAALQATPPHALLITAPTGAGKASLARQLGANWLGTKPAKLTATSRYMAIEPLEGERYGVEAIAQIQHFLDRRAAPGANGIAKVALIIDADQLSRDGQNKLLKTLEEPPAGCSLVLTASSRQAVLSTISSRCQSLELIRPQASDLQAWLTGQGHSADAAQLALSAADGWPGTALELLSGQADEASPIKQARQILVATSFERLTAVDKLAKDQGRAIAVCQTLQQMAHLALTKSPAHPQRWAQIQAAAYDCETALRHNANRKLALTNLMLNL